MDKNFPLSGFSSLAVHGGHEQDPNYAHLVPIYASSTFVFDEAEQGMRRFSGQEEGYIYSRWGNPTFYRSRRKDRGVGNFWFQNNSGSKRHSSCIGYGSHHHAHALTLETGDKILTHYSLYGGTEELITKVLPALGITAVIADLRDLNKAEEALKTIQLLKCCTWKRRPTPPFNAWI